MKERLVNVEDDEEVMILKKARYAVPADSRMTAVAPPPISPMEAEVKARVEAFGNELEAAAAIKREREKAEAKPELGGGPAIAPAPFIWNAVTAGPFLLSGPNAPPAPLVRPNRLVASGSLILIYGIAYAANADTVFALNAKEYVARFESCNMSTMTPGPSATLAGPAFEFGVTNFTFPAGVFVTPATGEFHVFYWLTSAFTAPGGPGTAPHLYDINFTIDVKPTGVPLVASAIAAFAEWHWDPDSSLATPNPIGLPVTPGTADGWRYGTSNRIGVYPFPN